MEVAMQAEANTEAEKAIPEHWPSVKTAAGERSTARCSLSLKYKRAGTPAAYATRAKAATGYMRPVRRNQTYECKWIRWIR